jgi:hypothetical protein
MSRVWDEPYHVVIEIKNKGCRVLEALENVGLQRFRIVDVRGLTGGLTRHLVELPSEYVDKILKTRIVKTKEVSKFEEKTSFWFESEGCNLCNTILSHGSFLISGRNVEDATFIYSFIAPNFDAFKSIISVLERSNFKTKILRVEKYEPKGKILTRKQERVLWLALKMGFFDYPRKINTEEFARKLGISPSTMSEVIRRGIKRLLEYHFEA